MEWNLFHSSLTIQIQFHPALLFHFPQIQPHFHHHFLFSVKMKIENNQTKHSLRNWAMSDSLLLQGRWPNNYILIKEDYRRANNAVKQDQLRTYQNAGNWVLKYIPISCLLLLGLIVEGVILILLLNKNCIVYWWYWHHLKLLRFKWFYLYVYLLS